MKYMLTGIRALLILLNTAFQISRLVVDGWINGKTKERSFKHRRRWARSSIKILGIHVEEAKGAISVRNALIISNHRTLLDPVIQAAYMDAFIIAKAEVASLPIISQGAKMTGIIFVRREKLRSRLAAREMTKDVLLAGENVLVYAEGTTGTNRTTDKFKPGTFAIAAEESLPVVPVAIDYPEQKDYWYEHSMAKQMLGQIGTRKTRVKLRILPPVYGDNATEILSDVQRAIDENLLDMQKEWSEIF